MNVYVNVKQAGKRRSAIEKQLFVLCTTPTTVEELITEFLTQCVKQFNERKPLDYLLSETINEAAYSGKIGFGDCENMEQQVVAPALVNALQSYEDGLYRIFINDCEVEGSLSTAITLQEGDTLTFVRLVMLAGRMW